MTSKPLFVEYGVFSFLKPRRGRINYAMVPRFASTMLFRYVICPFAVPSGQLPAFFSSARGGTIDLRLVRMTMRGSSQSFRPYRGRAVETLRCHRDSSLRELEIDGVPASPTALSGSAHLPPTLTSVS